MNLLFSRAALPLNGTTQVFHLTSLFWEAGWGGMQVADVALKALLDHGRARPVGVVVSEGPGREWGGSGENLDLTPAMNWFA